MKKILSILLVLVLMFTFSVSALAYEVDRTVEMPDIISQFTMDYEASSTRLSLVGEIKSNIGGARKTVAEGHCYKDGRELGQAFIKTNLNTDYARVNRYQTVSSGEFEFNFYGFTDFGVTGDITRYYANDNAFFQYPNDARGISVSQFLFNLSDEILTKMNFNKNSFVKTTIADKSLPYELINYYFGLDKGAEHTRPVIYVNSSNQQYLIVYQQGNGLNVVEQVNLSTARSNGAISTQRYAEAGVRVDYTRN